MRVRCQGSTEPVIADLLHGQCVPHDLGEVSAVDAGSCQVSDSAGNRGDGKAIDHGPVVRGEVASV